MRLRTKNSLTKSPTARRSIRMMFLRTELGGKATRESAIAAAYLRSQRHFALVATLPGRPSTNEDWIRPGS
jgi:hypothetical protein